MPSKYSTDNPIFRVLFTIYGDYYGTDFCQLTMEQAKRLRVKGYCVEKYRTGVLGEVQGFEGPLTQMKHWLVEEGSPYNRISKTIFKDQQIINDFTFNNFRWKPIFEIDKIF